MKARFAQAVALLLGAAAFARADSIYVSSLFSHEVLRYDAITGAYQGILISAGSGGLNEPHGILDRGTDLLVVSLQSDQILRYDRTTGAFLGQFAGPVSGMDGPVYLAIGPDGNLYVSSQLTDQILRFTPGGAPLGVFVTAGSGGLDGPSGLAFGPDGRLYVAGRFSANVLAYDGTTGAFAEVIADSTDGLGAGVTFGTAFDDGGDLYFASNGNVYRYDLDTAAIIAMIPAVFPIGIERGPDGFIYVATNNNLRRINPADNSISPPILTGGAISTLNFFHFEGGACNRCPGDFDLSASVDLSDVPLFVDRLLGGTGLPCADVNQDGVEDGRDAAAMAVAVVTGGCPQ